MNQQSTERKLKISIIAPDLSGSRSIRAYLLSQVIIKLNYDVKVFGFFFKENLYPVPPSDLTVCSVTQQDISTATSQFFIKLTDAMAMTKLILSTIVGDIPEILKGVSYLTKANYPEAMADKIKYAKILRKQTN